MSWQAKLECKDEPVIVIGLTGKWLMCEGHYDEYGSEPYHHIAEIEQVVLPERTEGTQRYIDSGEYEGEYGKD